MAKPSDWDDHIDVTGYFFLNEGVRGSYKPPQQLADFLGVGPAPVYIGESSTSAMHHPKLIVYQRASFVEGSMRRLVNACYVVYADESSASAMTSLSLKVNSIYSTKIIIDKSYKVSK